MSCRYHHENPSPDDKKEGSDRLDDISPWDKKFIEVDQDMLFQLITSSNYLDIKPLLDLACKSVALMIKGKSPEEIRKTFSARALPLRSASHATVANAASPRADILTPTPEEEEEVRRANPWLDEK